MIDQKTINRDYCNLFQAKYLKDRWGIVVGYNTISSHIAIMRKRLLHLQSMSDCDNSLCTDISLVIIMSKGTRNLEGPILNPALSPGHHRHYRLNVNEIIVGTFRVV